MLHTHNMSRFTPHPESYLNSFGNERLQAALMWDRMLAPIPTLFGKLVTVASFRDGVSDEYRHPALGRILSPEVAHHVLRKSHERLFAEWIGLFIDQQRIEIRRYLAAARSRDVCQLLMKARGCLTPPSVNPVGCGVFLRELEQLLTADYCASFLGWASEKFHPAA
jgi:hypothetical protein